MNLVEPKFSWNICWFCLWRSFLFRSQSVPAVSCSEFPELADSLLSGWCLWYMACGTFAWSGITTTFRLASSLVAELGKTLQGDLELLTALAHFWLILHKKLSADCKTKPPHLQNHMHVHHGVSYEVHLEQTWLLFSDSNDKMQSPESPWQVE